MEGQKSFEVERRADHLRLTLHPDLNAFHWDDIEKSAASALDEIAAQRSPAAIIDLSNLNYLGSAQVTLLVRIWKALQARNGRMVVQVHAPVVRQVLTTAGLDSLWQFAETRDDAFKALGLQGDGRADASGAWLLGGVLALAGAAAVFGLSIARPQLLSPRAFVAAQLACSAVALGTGLLVAMRGAGLRRKLGAALVVAGAGLAVAHLLLSRNEIGVKPTPAPAAPPAAESQEPQPPQE